MTSVNPCILPAVAFRVNGEPQDNAQESRFKWMKSCCEQTKTVARVTWDIVSFVVFPILIYRIAAEIIAPRLVLPASRKFSIKLRDDRIDSIEKKLAKGKDKLENHIRQLMKKIEGLNDDQQTKKQKFEYELSSNVQKLQSLIESSSKEIDELKGSVAEINRIHQARNDFISKNTNAEQVTVETEDGVEIDTVKIKNGKSDKWIVYFCPNASCYEVQLDELKKISDLTGANVYTGNYRGVMRSKGGIRSTHDMILDGKAMVQKLISEGVPPENILIQGWSIGGGVATEVAANFPKAHLCNLSSFGSLSSVLKAHMPVIGTLLGGFATLTGWKFDSVANYQKIEGKKLVIYCKSDAVILYKSSLFKMLKNKNIEVNSLEITTNPDRSEYIKNWKANHPEIDDLTAKKLAKKEFIRKVGVEAHSLSFSSVDTVFESYIKFVKEALQLAG